MYSLILLVSKLYQVKQTLNFATFLDSEKFLFYSKANKIKVCGDFFWFCINFKGSIFCLFVCLFVCCLWVTEKKSKKQRACKNSRKNQQKLKKKKTQENIK